MAAAAPVLRARAIWLTGSKDDGGARSGGEFSGAVGGVVVAHDQLGLPLGLGEGCQRGLNAAQGIADEFFSR